MINQERKLINIDPDLLINSKQAAEILNISERAVRGLVTRGTLPAARYGGKYYFHRGAIEFLKKFRAVHDTGRPIASVTAHCRVNEQSRSASCKASAVPEIEPLEFSQWPPVYPLGIMDLWQKSHEDSRYGIKFRRRKHPDLPDIPDFN